MHEREVDDDSYVWEARMREQGVERMWPDWIATHKIAVPSTCRAFFEEYQLQPRTLDIRHDVPKLWLLPDGSVFGDHRVCPRRGIHWCQERHH